MDSISDLHRYFTSLTYSNVHYKPFHNQLSKPEFLDMMKRLTAMAMGNWQQQVLGNGVNLSSFKQIVVQDASSFAVHDFLPHASSLKDNLFMPDRGYFNLSYLKEIADAGGSYVVRAKTTSNPLKLAGYNAQGKRLKRLTKLKYKR
jgi:hypothetical protein